MLLNLKYYISIFYFSLIYSYVMFPLYIKDQNISLTDTPNEFIDKIMRSDYYILINIGSKNISVKAFLDSFTTELMIAGEGVKYSKYNESISGSYECIYCVNKEYYSGWYSEGVISTEDFYIQNNFSQFDLVHKIKFIVGKKSIYMDPPEGVSGLQLPIFNSDPDYNIINTYQNQILSNNNIEIIFYEKN